jgi:16S rRNA (cytosine967-C5)-methyltransferase
VNARAVALRALRTWRTSRSAADEIFGELVGKSQLSSADRAFVLELFYGVLRNLTLLDFWIRALRSGKVDVDLADILRLGLYQLLIAEVAEHAAVNEMVALAPKRTRAVVNAVLREAIRQDADLSSRALTQPLHVRFSQPEFLLGRWRKNFGENAVVDLCEWNNRPPPIYARVNRLKISVDDFVSRNRGSLILPEHTNFVRLQSLPRNALERGECYVQDPSTRLACEMLEPKPGERVLDACAAPGGKTSYIAELMQNEGEILAVDRQSIRLKTLNANLKRLGVTIAQSLQHDWGRGPIPIEPFDRILVDAPCSNTGVMRRRVDLRWRLRPNEFERMREEQLSILRAVLPLLKDNGVLVYSTCSLEPEENREVLAAIEKEMSILQLVTEAESLPFRDGFDGAYVAKLIKTPNR